MSGHEGEWPAPRPDGMALTRLQTALRRLGYEIEPERTGAPPGSELIARRDLGNRVILLAVDRAGRFRIDITWQAGEWPSRQTLGGTPVRVVASVTRAVSIAGQFDEGDRLLEVVADLDRFMPWAGTVNHDGVDSSDSAADAHSPPPP